MTSTVTISCPDGIVLSADTRITRVRNGEIVCFEDNVTKIFEFRRNQVGASYWGLAELDGKPMLDVLSEFDQEVVEGSDDVNTISEKLVGHFRRHFRGINDRMGVHVAGYCKGDEGTYPQIRHVFHMKYHSPGEFTNEDSNVERHSLTDGTVARHPYNPYVSVFNGDYTVASALFNYLPYLKQGRRPLVLPDQLNLDQCVELAKFVIESSAKIIPFVYELNQGVAGKMSQTVLGLTIAKITKIKGFEFVR